jgi:PAS domain-containing protein
LVAEVGEREVAEQAARESEAQLNAYFEASPEELARLDLEFERVKDEIEQERLIS